MSLKQIFCIFKTEDDTYDFQEPSSYPQSSMAPRHQGKGTEYHGKGIEKQHVLDEDEMKQRLDDMRREISNAKVDWYVIPSEDEHQSEYVGASDQRREYVSGFTGTAGTAIIPSFNVDSKALLFVDSRYWVQAEKQVSEGWEVIRVGSSSGGSGGVSVEKEWTQWALYDIEDGARIGIDPKTFSLSAQRALQATLNDEGAETKLIPLSTNLVDRIHEPSPRPKSPLNDYPLSIAGKSATDKLNDLRLTLSSKIREGEDWIYLIPALTSIAWLFNFRCEGDVDGCPIAYAYAAVTKDKAILFVEEAKVQDEGLRARFEADGTEIRPYGVKEIEKLVKDLVAKSALKEKKSGFKLWAPKECSWALQEACKPNEISIIPCPIEDAKAIKNESEIQGMRNAYLRDGRATARFIAFLEQKLVKENRPVGEWAAGQILTRYRRQEENFKMSAGEISASGPNAASPHYTPQRGQDSLIDVDAPYLFDTGAQYLDGTIDTTRTVFFGKTPSDEVKRGYTRVLQAHIAIATSVFPEGTSADWLNMLAKKPLFEDGLDFQHGLGHGVGCYLGVHEYPVSFPHGYSFKPGVVTTVEPGYYKEIVYGVRTESLFVCKEVEMENKDETDKRRWLGWERLTQVPIQSSLVDWSFMSKAEIRWLNDHNKGVEEAVMPQLTEDQDGPARDWLKRVCKPKKIWPWTGKKDE